MEGGGKAVIVVVLILAVVVAGYFIWRNYTAGPQMSDELSDERARQPVKVLDTETGEVITLTMGELGEPKDERYLNPKTEKYALARSWGTCPKCGKKVAKPFLNLGPDAAAPVIDEKLAELWKCPDCGVAISAEAVGAAAREAAGK